MDHLIDAGRGHPSALSEPQVGDMSETVPVACPQVPIKRHRRLEPDRQRPRPAALPEHPDEALVKVEVVELDPDALGPSHAGVYQEEKDGRVPPADEVPALARLE